MTSATTRQAFWRIIIAAFVAFALYSNVRLVIRNNTLNQLLVQATSELQEKETRNRRLALLIAYYESPSYQEVEARRRLSLQKPGETVLEVRGVEYGRDGTTLEDWVYENVEPTPPTPPSNFSRWWEYFFGG
jgi:cell division protein FtsB